VLSVVPSSASSMTPETITRTGLDLGGKPSVADMNNDGLVNVVHLLSLIDS
jgi:hypothetical protein